MQKMLKRTWAEISLDNLTHNFKLVRSSLNSGCMISAVVKADAYGHGAVTIARHLDSLGADGFTVATIEEAIELRNAGIVKPVLVLGYTPAALIRKLIDCDLTQAVFSLDYSRMLSAEAVSLGSKIKIHIKVDTGMSRMGFCWQDVKANAVTVDEIIKVCRLPGIEPEGIFTHFACSDESRSAFTSVQYKRFTALLLALEGSSVRFEIRHCCNSGGIIDFPDTQLDMVRPGIMLYGASPGEGICERPDLRPVMKLITTVVQVRTISNGQTVSYGQTFSAKRQTKVATVAIGYADGLFRSLSNKAEMLVSGKRVPIIGRVCMDQTMLDVTDLPEISEGEQVTVFGGGEGESPILVEEHAGWAGTICYESLCSVGKRVPRFYL